MKTKRMPLPKIINLCSLLVQLKPQIMDDYIEEEDSLPSIQVTIGANIKGEWDYQTGDNSYTGRAYSYPHWAVIQLYRRSNSLELARDIRNQLSELMQYEWENQDAD
jgi:hypothetical protein